MDIKNGPVFSDEINLVESGFKGGLKQMMEIAFLVNGFDRG